MQYFATIYIDPIFELEGFTHAFLGLTHTHPDELDKIDSEIKMQKLKMLIGKILIKNGMKNIPHY